MNLHIPDVRILEVHLTPWKSPHSTRQLSSVLEERSDLGLPLLRHAIEDAAGLGYNFLNVAGRNVLSHPSLPAVCREAHQHGMLTSTITRNSPLTASQLEWLRFSIDLLGVEIDGRAATRHSRRRYTRTPQSMERRLMVVRDSGIPFAIVFTLTPDNLGELEWAARYASAQGAAMLHVVPSPELTSEQMATAWMMMECLREMRRGKMALHLDAVNRYSLPLELDDLTRWKERVQGNAGCLSEILTPLVIEDDGTVSPMGYGFPRGFAFGNIQEQRLARMAGRWIDAHAGPFCEMYGRVLHKARTAEGLFADLPRMLMVEAESGESGMLATG